MKRAERSTLTYWFFTAVLVGTSAWVASCGGNDPAYQQFTSRRDQIRHGIDRSEVEAILGKPLNAFSSDALPDPCKRLHAETAMTYDFEHANRVEKLLASFVTRTPPSVTRVTVCMDANRKVNGLDTSLITH